MTYDAIRACSIAILSGVVLQTSGVSAGNGTVVDWRTVKSGEAVQSDTNAFDTAQLFVSLVGSEAAMAAANGEPPAAFVPPVPDVSEFMRQPNGGRLRSFTAPAGFKVMIAADENDQEQAIFAAWLAEKSMEYAQ